MDIEKVDSIHGLSIMILGVITIPFNSFIWSPLLMIGMFLSSGILRNFYNKYFCKSDYWKQQKKLWKNTQ